MAFFHSCLLRLRSSASRLFKLLDEDDKVMVFWWECLGSLSPLPPLLPGSVRSPAHHLSHEMLCRPQWDRLGWNGTVWYRVRLHNPGSDGGSVGTRCGELIRN